MNPITYAALGMASFAFFIWPHVDFFPAFGACACALWLLSLVVGAVRK